MGWIKGLGNSECCPDCGATPCAECGECTFFETETGEGPATFSYSVSGQFGTSHTIGIDFLAPVPVAEAQLLIYANGVLIYDSGCLSNGPYSASVSVPGGTTTIDVSVVICVSSGEDDWSFTLSC